MSFLNRNKRTVKTKAQLERAFESEMPDASFVAARNAYFDSVGQPVVDKARFFVISVMLGVLCLLLGSVLLYMTPLKTTEPYVVYVDKDSGKISKAVGEVVRAVEYTPDRPVLEREIFQFVERLYALNSDYARIIQDGHVASYGYVRGRAIEEFKSFLASDQPYQRMKSNPGLLRMVERKTMSFREDGKLVLIRFRTSERSGVQPVSISRDWLMTLQFERSQPTDRAELEKNPLGLYITHFEIVEER